MIGYSKDENGLTSYASTTSKILDEIKTQEIESDVETINISNNAVADKYTYTGINSDFKIENPINISPDVLNDFNQYRGYLQYTGTQITGKASPEGQTGSRVVVYDKISTASLFNPYYTIGTAGIAPRVPLLDTSKHQDELKSIAHNGQELKKNLIINTPTDDCSISTLVTLSKYPNSPLGNARYKYSDFMYCKDVGKVSNNHLITLRRFLSPVADNIFEATNRPDKASNVEYAGDVGRLITWFGTDDNKLEDILKYTYKATWKELEAKRQELPSEETNPERGMLGGFANLFNPSYQQAVASGRAPSALNLILGSDASDAIYTDAPYKDNPVVNGAMYDKNKVYEQKDAIRSTHIYDGSLEFNHSFTLNFSYKLRGYDNINPKSAFLDLLGNIMAVTYKFGTFWPGEQRIIGAPQNTAGWNKAQAFSKKVLDSGETFITSLMSGSSFGDSTKALIGNLGQALGSIGIEGGSITELLQSAGSKFAENFKNNQVSALKGLLQNQMGRPAIYAFDSLLTNDNVGTWHVTIGNPLNPIIAMGNLIIDNVELSHSGPLGLDDFPTELKVSITLKHATPRDSVDIQRMYTQGRTAIYSKLSNAHNINRNSGLAYSATGKSKETTTADASSATESSQSGKVFNQTILADINERFTDLSDGSTSSFAGWIGDCQISRINKILEELK